MIVVVSGKLSMRTYLALLAVVVIGTFIADRSIGQQISGADFAQYRDEEFRFSIHYPRSWAKVEASHRETRFKAVSNNGSGADDVSVVVTTLPASEEGFTSQEFLKSINVQEYLRYARQNVPGATLIEHGPTMLSNQPAYYFVMQLTHRLFGIDVPMRQLQIQTARGRNVYTITFRTEPERYSDAFAVFQLMAAGLVLWPEPPDAGLLGSPAQLPGKDSPIGALAGGLRALLLIGLFGLGAGILRFLLIGRAVSKTCALGVVAPVWLALLWLHHQAGWASPPAWLGAGAVVAFFLLISGQKSAKPNLGQRDESDG